MARSSRTRVGLVFCGRREGREGRTAACCSFVRKDHPFCSAPPPTAKPSQVPIEEVAQRFCLSSAYILMDGRFHFLGIFARFFSCAGLFIIVISPKTKKKRKNKASGLILFNTLTREHTQQEAREQDAAHGAGGGSG